jgi:hypothetical protein
LQLIELFAHRGDNLGGIGAAHRNDDALHRLALAVLGNRTIAGQAAGRDGSDIAEANDPASAIGDDLRLQVIDRLHRPDDTDDQRFLAFSQPASAIVAVARHDRAAQIGDRQPGGGQRHRIRTHIEGDGMAAQRIDIGDTCQRAQCRADRPVEQGPLGGEIERAFDGEHQHVGQRRRDRREAAFDQRRHLVTHARQAFGGLLARPIDIGAILEIDGDVGDRIFGDRAQHHLIGNSQHFGFDGGDDAGFHLLRGHPRCLQDDLNLGGGDIRKGVDRERGKGPEAKSRHQHGDADDQ